MSIFLWVVLLFLPSLSLHGKTPKSKNDWKTLTESGDGTLKVHLSPSIDQQLSSEKKRSLGNTIKRTYTRYKNIFFPSSEQIRIRLFEGAFQSRKVRYSAHLKTLNLPKSVVQQKLKKYKSPEQISIYFTYTGTGRPDKTTMIMKPFELLKHSQNRSLEQMRFQLRGEQINFRTLMEIQHELFHAFFKRRFLGTEPEWINEGLAEILPLNQYLQNGSARQKKQARKYIKQSIKTAKNTYNDLSRQQVYQFLRAQAAPVDDEQYIALSWALVAYLKQIKEHAPERMLEGIMNEMRRIYAFKNIPPGQQYVEWFFNPKRSRNIQRLKNDLDRFFESLQYDPQKPSGIRGRTRGRIKPKSFPLPVIDVSGIRTESTSFSNMKDWIQFDYSRRRKWAEVYVKPDKISSKTPRTFLRSYLKKLTKSLKSNPIEEGAYSKRQQKINRHVYNAISSTFDLQTIKGSVRFRNVHSRFSPKILIGFHFAEDEPTWKPMHWVAAHEREIPETQFFRKLNSNNVWVVAFWVTSKNISYLKARKLPK